MHPGGTRLAARFDSVVAPRRLVVEFRKAFEIAQRDPVATGSRAHAGQCIVRRGVSE
jgi:hypothetical protein